MAAPFDKTKDLAFFLKMADNILANPKAADHPSRTAPLHPVTRVEVFATPVGVRINRYLHSVAGDPAKQTFDLDLTAEVNRWLQMIERGNHPPCEERWNRYSGACESILRSMPVLVAYLQDRSIDWIDQKFTFANVGC